MKYACQYAIVRFLPYVETGEFANVGIVLLCPQKRYFDFKLTSKRHKRVTDFFHQIDGQIYRDAIGFFKEELTRVGKLITAGVPAGNQQALTDAEFAQRIFTEMTRPREAMLRFDSLRVVLSDDPVQTLNDLFNYYVEHDFVKHGNKQQELERQIRHTLLKNRLDKLYEPRTIGDELFNEKFPFVRGTNAMVRVIKPLHFAQQEPAKVLEFGVTWAGRIRKLADKKFIQPNNVLFAVQGPEPTAGDKFIVNFQEALEDLEKEGARVALASNDDAIVGFAAN